MNFVLVLSNAKEGAGGALPGSIHVHHALVNGLQISMFNDELVKLTCLA